MTITGIRTTAHRATVASTALTPGLVVTGVATGIAMAIGHFLPTVSPLLIAILLGAVLANVVQLPQRITPGLAFSAKRLLRIGVALLGLQLIFGDILALGPGMIVVVVAIVGLGISGSMLVGRWLGLEWKQRLLISCGFSICGAAAAAAVDGVIESDEEDLLTTVALVVIFGTLMIPVIPLAGHLLGLSDLDAGLWAGGSIHEVAQVVAAGSSIGGAALAVAIVVKLARVLMLAPVIAVIGMKQRATGSETGHPPLIPLFVVGFIACAALRTTGLLPHGVVDGAKIAQTALLTAAMFALGAGVRIAALRKVGLRPFALALFSTVWVAGISLGGILLAG